MNVPPTGGPPPGMMGGPPPPAAAPAAPGATIPLALLIDFGLQRTYHELQVLSELWVLLFFCF